MVNDRRAISLRSRPNVNVAYLTSVESAEPLEFPEPKTNDPRQHHLVPSFYLTGFTQGATKKSTLHVFDYETAKLYPSSPSKAAKELDYYRLDVPGAADAFAMERAMGINESVLAPHVRRVGAGEKGINKRDVGETLSLAALIHVRGRTTRQTVSTHAAARVSKLLRRGEVTPAQWDDLRTIELRHGATAAEYPPYAEAIEGLRRGTWFPSAPRAPTVAMIPEAQDALMKTLHQREWELHVTDPEQTGGFITCDDPLVWGRMEVRFAGSGQHLDESDEITFPVSRRTALVSFPGARAGSCLTTDEVVARTNTRTLHSATRFIYFSGDDFLLLRMGSGILKGSEFFDYVADARRRGIVNP